MWTIIGTLLAKIAASVFGAFMSDRRNAAAVTTSILEGAELSTRDVIDAKHGLQNVVNQTDRGVASDVLGRLRCRDAERSSS